MNFSRSLTWAGMALLAASTLFSGNARAQILPDNYLYLEDDVNNIANLTQPQFNELVDEVIKAYAPLAQIHGATLTATKDWTSNVVNAFASQAGNKWMVGMYGALARRPEVTVDAFTMVVCHEVGHHFGGFPFKGASWAATEGQADYFATQTCARMMWSKDQAGNARARSGVGAYERSKCDAAYHSRGEQDLCYRTAAAGQSLANLLAALGSQKMPKFETPDPKKVGATNGDHPQAQCRLDTYFAGALCGKFVDSKVIPGKNHPAGQGSLDAEKEASKYSCFASATNPTGSRPRCWFFPRVVGDSRFDDLPIEN